MECNQNSLAFGATSQKGHKSEVFCVHNTTKCALNIFVRLRVSSVPLKFWYNKYIKYARTYRSKVKLDDLMVGRLSENRELSIIRFQNAVSGFSKTILVVLYHILFDGSGLKRIYAKYSL